MDTCERRNQSLNKRGKCDYVGAKAPSSSPLLCCRSHPPFVAASDRSSSLTYTDEINSTATERDALNKDQRQPKPQVAGGALCLCHPGGRQSVAATTAATRRSSSMSSLHISGDRRRFFFLFWYFFVVFYKNFQEKIFWRGNGKTLMRKSLEEKMLRKIEKN